MQKAEFNLGLLNAYRMIFSIELSIEKFILVKNAKSKIQILNGL